MKFRLGITKFKPWPRSMAVRRSPALQQASIREALPTGSNTTGSSQAGAQNSAGKIRIGIAPPEAQVGQGNNSGDYSTPVRNAEIALMSGPLVSVVPLDSHVAMQLQAEAQQKQCNYLLYSSVVVKHGQVSGLGKFTKYGGMAASVTPIGAMAHGVTGTLAAQAAEAAVSQLAQRQAMNELAAFSGQIKSRDDVSVQYQLVPTGQSSACAAELTAGESEIRRRRCADTLAATSCNQRTG